MLSWLGGGTWHKMVAQLLKVSLVVACENVLVAEKAVAGAMFQASQKIRGTNAYKDRSWLVAAKL